VIAALAVVEDGEQPSFVVDREWLGFVVTGA
jgi:hypothetical protein